MNGLHVKFTTFTQNDTLWIGVIIGIDILHLSIMLAFCPSTGQSYQLTLPGF